LTRTALVKLSVPSIVAAAALAALMIGVYGGLPLWRTLVPFSGAHAYRVQHLGLLGEGQYFLYSPGVRPGYYVGTFAGIWIVGTIWLFGAAAVCASRFIAGLRDHLPVEMAREMVLTCGLLQIIFITILFGTAQSWAYYSYVLVMGIAASSKLSQQAGYVLAGFAFLALLSQKASWQDSIRAWRDTRRAPDALGLWTPPDEANEWSTVRKLATGKSATILSCDGSAEVEFAEFRKPVSLFLVRGLATSGEIERKAEQISSSSIVVIPQFDEASFCQLPAWPEFAVPLKSFRPISVGKYFNVLAKDADARPAPDDSPAVR